MPGLNFLKVIGNVFHSKSAEVAVKTVEKETTVLSKEMPKIVEGLSPSQTLAFGAPKLPAGRPLYYFNDLLTDAFQKSSEITTLQAIKAPQNLIRQAYKRLPIKVLPQASLPKVFSSNKVQSKIKDKQIQLLLEEFEKEQQNKREVLKRLENGISHTKFADAKISDPDEIIELINSNKYGNHEVDMFKALSKTGAPDHAKELLAKFGDVSYACNGKYCGDPLSSRISTIAAIGDDAQKTCLVTELDIALTVNHDPMLKKAIFNGISQVGETNPKDEQFVKLLLKHTDNQYNRGLAYEHLSAFDGQFDVIHKGLIQNPESKEILISAYKAAKSSEQKELLLKSILNDIQLTSTAIGATPSIYDIELKNAYKYDILSHFLNPDVNKNLSTFHQGSVARHLKID